MHRIKASSQTRGKSSSTPTPACVIDAKHIASLGHHSLPRVFFLSKAPLNAAACLPLDDPIRMKQVDPLAQDRESMECGAISRAGNARQER